MKSNDKTINECFMCNNSENKSENKNNIISIYDDYDNTLNIVKNNYDCFQVCKIDTLYINDKLLSQIEEIKRSDIIIININGNNSVLKFKKYIKNTILKFINHLESMDIYIPILFICRGIQIKKIYEFLKIDYIFDVLNSNFSNDEFKNKLDTLIKITRYKKNIDSQKSKINHAIWDLLNYSNLFIIILNRNFEIVVCSDRLSKVLGYNDSDELVGKNWIEFIPDYLKNTFSKMKKEIFEGKQCVREYTNEIIIKNDELLTVKWFNSYINHEINWAFSIGIPFKIYDEESIPINVDNENDINNIRSYFNDILNRDQIVLNSLKSNKKSNILKDSNIGHLTKWNKRRNNNFNLIANEI